MKLGYNIFRNKPYRLVNNNIYLILRQLIQMQAVSKNLDSFLLEWVATTLTIDPTVKIHTFISIPYNPYEPHPYSRWTMRGMLDLDHELKVAEEFWDFLGGENTYSDLLDCFEKAGIALRPEIDEYFDRFNKNN
jgi:type II restriction enzyme